MHKGGVECTVWCVKFVEQLYVPPGDQNWLASRLCLESANAVIIQLARKMLVGLE
jgi:hypothetical protein